MDKEGQPGGMLQVDTTHLQVAGVIKDFVYNDMYGASMPALFVCVPNATTLMTIRFRPGISQTKALEKVAAVIQANNPGFPFEFRFVDDDFNKLFITETLIGKLAAALWIPHGYSLVGLCAGWYSCINDHAHHCKPAGFQSCIGQPAKEFKNRVSLLSLYKEAAPRKGLFIIE